MGQSGNPDGTAQVSDEQILDALREAYDESEPDAITVTSSEVADYLPIKRPAVKKRLDKLALEDGGVKRYKGTQAYNYYPAEVSNDPDTVVPASTPASAPVEPTRRGWREYLTRITSVVIGEPTKQTKAWYDHPETGLDLTPLVHLLRRFIQGIVLGLVSSVPVVGISNTATIIALIAGSISMVWAGVSMLINTRVKNNV